MIKCVPSHTFFNNFLKLFSDDNLLAFCLLICKRIRARKNINKSLILFIMQGNSKSTISSFYSWVSFALNDEKIHIEVFSFLDFAIFNLPSSQKN